MGILRRTIYLAQDNTAPNTGTPIRHSGWALVTTSLGMCAEPCPNPWPFFVGVSSRQSLDTTVGGQNTHVQDFSDDISRIDAIEWLPLTSVSSPFMSSDQNRTQIHGGTCVPRKGP